MHKSARLSTTLLKDIFYQEYKKSKCSGLFLQGPPHPGCGPAEGRRLPAVHRRPVGVRRVLQAAPRGGRGGRPIQTGGSELRNVNKSKGPFTYDVHTGKGVAQNMTTGLISCVNGTVTKRERGFENPKM